MSISPPPSRMDKSIRSQDKENAQPPQQQEEDGQEEEALSLCDLPLNSDEPDNPKTRDHQSRRSSSEPTDIFEFFNVNNDNLSMSHAEDIIYRGKLIPYAYNNNSKSLFDEQILQSYHEDALNLSRRYCDSLPTRSNNNSMRLDRSSRSLDRGRKTRRNSSLVMKSGVAETRQQRSFSRGSNSSRPRWYNLMFGSVKIPREMDLRDMKSRQVRRSPGSKFAAEGGGSGRRSSSWGHGLMRVLSCKNNASVDVMASSSIGLVPQV